MVDEELLEKVCSEVSEYTDEQMVDEFDRFFRAQPSVCEFIVELTHESGQKIQELSLFLSYMVFKTMESANAGSTSMIQAEDIEGAYRDTESWMERISHADESVEMQSAIVASLQQYTEPYLLQYVIGELNDPMEDGAHLNEEQKGEVFFVLKTVISSFKQNEPKNKIIQLN
jgi:DNA phosphorothioation-dependent restriction protein DptG